MARLNSNRIVIILTRLEKKIQQVENLLKPQYTIKGFYNYLKD